MRRRPIKLSYEAGDLQTVDTVLQNFSVGELQEKPFAADILFPFVPVEKETGTYYKHDPSASRRAVEAIRARKARSAQVEQAITDATFSCKEYALHDILEDAIVANADVVVRGSMRERTAKFVLNLLRLAREKRAVTLATTVTNYPTAHRITGGADWEIITIDSRDEVNQAKELIRQKWGDSSQMAILMTTPVLNALRKNNFVMEAIKYTMAAKASDITPALLAGFYGVDRLFVAGSTEVTSKEGQTVAVADLWPDDVIVFRYEDNPMTNDVGLFGVTHAVSNDVFTNGIQSNRWREEGVRGEIIEECMCVQENIVNNNLGVHIDNVLA